MPKINLLPQDLIPKTLTVKLAKIMTQIVVVGFALFIVGSVVLISLFVVNAAKLNNLNKTKGRLLESISNNQKAEQGLYLVKDRLGKVKTVLSEKTAIDAVKEVPAILAKLPATVTLSSAEFSSVTNNLVFTTTDSALVPQLVATLMAEKVFSTVNLNVFTFNETKGYAVGFELIK